MKIWQTHLIPKIPKANESWDKNPQNLIFHLQPIVIKSIRTVISFMIYVRNLGHHSTHDIDTIMPKKFNFPRDRTFKLKSYTTTMESYLSHNLFHPLLLSISIVVIVASNSTKEVVETGIV